MKRAFDWLSRENTFRFFGSVTGIVAIVAAVWAAWLQVSAINRQTSISAAEAARLEEVALTLRCDSREISYDSSGPRFNVFLVSMDDGVAYGMLRPSSPIGPADFPEFRDNKAIYGLHYFYPNLVEVCIVYNEGDATVDDTTISFNANVDGGRVDAKSLPLKVGPLPPIPGGSSYTITMANTELFNIDLVPLGAVGRVADGPMKPANLDVQGDKYIMVAGLEPLSSRAAQRWGPDERCVGASRTC